MGDFENPSACDVIVAALDDCSNFSEVVDGVDPHPRLQRCPEVLLPVVAVWATMLLLIVWLVGREYLLAATMGLQD